MTQRRIGVLLGGWGEERELSVKSGEAIVRALGSRGHEVTPIIAGPGLDKALRHAGVEVAFLGLHGRMGEDGRVQGLLEVLGIPYTGSGVLASALAMDKWASRQLFRQHNLATPTGYRVTQAELANAGVRHLDLGYPCVVKPARGGSGVGVTVVSGPAQLPAAVAEACRFGGEALVERFVKGREVTVSLLDGEVLGCCEVAPTGRSHLPPRLSSTRVANLEAMASTAWRALGCRGAAQVGFICPEDSNEVLLEVDTMPALEAGSAFARAARHAGLSLPDVCERLLSLATCEPAGVVPAPVVEPHVTASAS